MPIEAADSAAYLLNKCNYRDGPSNHNVLVPSSGSLPLCRPSLPGLVFLVAFCSRLHGGQINISISHPPYQGPGSNLPALIGVPATMRRCPPDDARGRVPLPRDPTRGCGMVLSNHVGCWPPISRSAAVWHRLAHTFTAACQALVFVFRGVVAQQ